MLELKVRENIVEFPKSFLYQALNLLAKISYQDDDDDYSDQLLHLSCPTEDLLRILTSPGHMCNSQAQSSICSKG